MGQLELFEENTPVRNFTVRVSIMINNHTVSPILKERQNSNPIQIWR